MKEAEDFVIYCDDGHPRKFVQRLRFSDSQDAWVPGGSTAETVNGDDSVGWHDGNPPGPSRQHIELRCTGRLDTGHNCTRRVRIGSQENLDTAIRAVRLQRNGPVKLSEFGAVHDRFAQLQGPRPPK